MSGHRSANTIRACGGVAARQGRIHDRKTRLHRCVIVLANWGWSIHIVLLEQQGADQADDGSFVWKDTDDLAAPFDLAVEPLERIGIGYAVAGFRRVRREACT